MSGFDAFHGDGFDPGGVVVLPDRQIKSSAIKQISAYVMPS
jgi:hypothetical protein